MPLQLMLEELFVLIGRVLKFVFLKPLSKYRVISFGDLILVVAMTYILYRKEFEDKMIYNQTLFYIVFVALSVAIITFLFQIVKNKTLAIVLIGVLSCLWGYGTYLLGDFIFQNQSYNLSTLRLELRLVFSILILSIIAIVKTKDFSHGMKNPNLAHHPKTKTPSRSPFNKLQTIFKKKKATKTSNSNNSKANNGKINNRATTHQAKAIKKKMTPYEVLGVSSNATKLEIKKSYIELIKKYHPDKINHLGEEFQEIAHNKMIEIQAAYNRIK